MLGDKLAPEGGLSDEQRQQPEPRHPPPNARRGEAEGRAEDVDEGLNACGGDDASLGVERHPRALGTLAEDRAASKVVERRRHLTAEQLVGVAVQRAIGARKLRIAPVILRLLVVLAMKPTEAGRAVSRFGDRWVSRQGR